MSSRLVNEKELANIEGEVWKIRKNLHMTVIGRISAASFG